MTHSLEHIATLKLFILDRQDKCSIGVIDRQDDHYNGVRFSFTQGEIEFADIKVDFHKLARDSHNYDFTQQYDDALKHIKP